VDPGTPTDPTTPPVDPASSAWTGSDPGGTTLPVYDPTTAAINQAAAELTRDTPEAAQAALNQLIPLAQANPSNATIQYNLGLAYFRAGNFNSARDSWVRTTSIDPSFAAAWNNLGGLAARDGNMGVALQQYQTGLSYAPTDMNLWAAQIAALRELKRTDEAIAAARKALAINSNALLVYTNLALVYLDLGQVDMAQFVLEKARADIPGANGNAQLHAILGEILYRKGYPGNALASFQQALDLDPNLIQALMFMSSYYLDNRAYEDALPLLERAEKLAPTSSGIKLNLGIAYRGLGRFDDAKRCYEEALKLDPSSPEPHRNLAILYGDHLKKYDEAIAEIEAYRKAGGGPAADLDKWIEGLLKEKKKKEKEEKLRRQQEEDAKREAEEERARQEEEARKKAMETPGTPDGGFVEPDPNAPQPDPSAPQPDPNAPQPDPNAPQPDPNTPQPEQPAPWGDNPQ
jgi:tetratricopeptide (TPR) repeat protein